MTFFNALIDFPFSKLNTLSTNRIGYIGYSDADNSGYLLMNIESASYIGWRTNKSFKSDVSMSTLTYYATSDYRIKENVETLDSRYTTENLRPVTYINKLSGNRDIGLIAHELQEIYPELVTGEKDGPENQTINYNGLIGILINDIKELKEEIKELKEEIKDIKNLLNI